MQFSAEASCNDKMKSNFADYKIQFERLNIDFGFFHNENYTVYTVIKMLA